MKGEPSRSLSEREEVYSLKLTPSEMETVRHQFDSRCRKILREENRSIRERKLRRAKKEMSFSQLPDDALDLFGVMDEYPSDCFFFNVSGYLIAVRDERLARSLAELPGKKRDVILLAFFLDMKDVEIAERLHVVGSTIHRRRKSSLTELKTRMERLEYE